MLAMRDVVDLRVQALHRDVEVAIERQLHRIVERQSRTGAGYRVAGVAAGCARADSGAGDGSLTAGEAVPAAARMSSLNAPLPEGYC